MNKHIINFSLLLAIVITISVSCVADEGPFIIHPNDEDNVQDTTVIDTTPVVEPTIFSYPIIYDTDVKPIWPLNCVKGCHNPSHPKLDLRPPVSYDQLLTDGLSAPYVDTLNPKQSSLYLHLTGVYTLMPKDGAKLSQGKIDTIYTWINQGAKK